MSKLSPALKALINAPFARPGQTPAPRNIAAIYQGIAREARERNYGDRPWLTLSAAATFTLNSPESLTVLHSVASTPPTTETAVSSAEVIREVGLKCISFNGIPRTINCLGGFLAGILATGPTLADKLERRPSRAVTAENIAEINARGRALWKSVYIPFDAKLETKLAESHPDLPVHILGSHYGPLLSDPPADKRGGLANIRRNLTSIVAISCLRAQTGVGPQVLSHVFGLRKGIEQGTHKEESSDAAEAEAIERLASDEGCEWILKSVDSISEAIGASFAEHKRESKL